MTHVPAGLALFVATLTVSFKIGGPDWQPGCRGLPSDGVPSAVAAN